MRVLWIVALIFATIAIALAVTIGAVVVLIFQGTRLGIATLHRLPRNGAWKVMK